jgi:hypothetical protein
MLVKALKRKVPVPSFPRLFVVNHGEGIDRMLPMSACFFDFTIGIHAIRHVGDFPTCQSRKLRKITTS